MSLKPESEVNLEVTVAKRYKGTLLYNDSIAISEVTPQITKNNEEIKAYNNYGKLYSVRPPFTLIKKTNNDTIRIVKNSDTIYFHFLDPKGPDLWTKSIYNASASVIPAQAGIHSPR